ncbi:E3 ubiquitin-protein ligase TRIM39-like [Kryptolebias marmoratus]|uniref:E3 ubiquitin-protein ligase TRIM39-like n=1 Tax=Kryptolebias marmoratus TaxID=37003 RepID=A0A3Q3ACH5_KRYMA|nr:E3 ubiquitin-protein ligase TRIM39-like [Kryptolebias marmoratus]
MSNKSLQTCGCCGWSKVTTYQGLRTHQGKMGCTPKGMRIPKSEQYHYLPKITFLPTPIQLEDPFLNIFKTALNPESEHYFLTSQWGEYNQKNNMPVLSTSFKEEKALVSPNLINQMNPAPQQVSGPSMVFTTQMNPPTTQTPFQDSNKSFFQTPPLSHQNSSDKACRRLDFSTEALKVEQPWQTATTTVQETVIQQKEKMNHQSSNFCGGSVQDILIKQCIVLRRQKVKREAQDLLHKLQKETDRLKDSLDELDKNPDFQVSLLSGLDESTDWKIFNIDTSFSFGTLRATTSTMMKEMQQKLENLTFLELKRIPAFAVDVKLDSATAHQCLVLSDDRKKVRDEGMKSKLPDAPERFDMFGSVLGINIITSGKSYWEVEVNNKTGWDLGVAHRRGNRKGIVTLNSDNGYWVAVHYEDKKYAALTVPPVSLSLKQKPQKVGVFVDYEEGLVSFYDVTNQSHIFSFTECSFRDEIVPYFSPHLKVNDKNTDPLIISAVQKR